MQNPDLLRRLRVMRRTVLILETELRRAHVDEKLVAELDTMLEEGIAADERCSPVRDLVDKLRETLLSTRVERYGDGVRVCQQLKDAIENVLSLL